jgi:hypothetical protein
MRAYETRVMPLRGQPGHPVLSPSHMEEFMKKAFLALIIVGLVTAGGSAFGQGKFTAWNEGVLYPYITVGSITTNGWAPHFDPPGNGIDQEWGFGYDGKDFGFTGTFEFGMDNFAASAANLSWFSTYYKVGDLARITLGKPRMSDYTQFSMIEGNDSGLRFSDSDFGGFLQVTPVTGLSVGAALYVPKADAFANTAALDYANNFGIALSYAVPDMMTLALYYRASGGATGTKQFTAGANISAVKAFPITVSYTGDFSNSANLVNKAFVSLGTGMAPVSVSVDAAVKMQTLAPTLSFAVEADAQYVLMGNWSLGATVGYDDGNGIKWFEQGDGVWAGLEVWPYLLGKFDNGSTFKVGFLYASGSTAATGSAAQMIVGVPIYYVWQF